MTSKSMVSLFITLNNVIEKDRSGFRFLISHQASTTTQLPSNRKRGMDGLKRFGEKEKRKCSLCSWQHLLIYLPIVRNREGATLQSAHRIHLRSNNKSSIVQRYRNPPTAPQYIHGYESFKDAWFCAEASSITVSCLALPS